MDNIYAAWRYLHQCGTRKWTTGIMLGAYDVYTSRMERTGCKRATSMRHRARDATTIPSIRFVDCVKCHCTPALMTSPIKLQRAKLEFAIDFLFNIIAHFLSASKPDVFIDYIFKIWCPLSLDRSTIIGSFSMTLLNQVVNTIRKPMDNYYRVENGWDMAPFSLQDSKLFEYEGMYQGVGLDPIFSVCRFCLDKKPYPWKEAGIMGI